ncbi:ATP-binding protein [Halobaculum sp. MBLA0147]|uniref:GAF domain-containing sensor histidine kinase n=1 Tax=Halobaculum sp. MBLA0147 TaxID=3079934 RepID=UPI003525A3BE
MAGEHTGCPRNGWPVTDGGVADETDGGVADETDGGVADETDGGVADEADGGVADEADGGVADEADDAGDETTTDGAVSSTTATTGDGAVPPETAGTAADATRLRRLHEATREMVAREREESIAAVAVDAAADILGFPFVSVRLHDEETDRLTPVAAAEETVARAGDCRPYERGETIQWEAFDEGETRLYPDVRAVDDAVERPGGGSMLVVPLGGRGVLTLGTPDTDGFDAADVETARVLGANLQTALERAARLRQIERHEDSLAAKTERLDRFASLVAHEFRNPLAIAAGHLELCAPRDDAESEHLGAARDAVDRMDRLTESILDLTSERGLTDGTTTVSVDYVARSVWAEYAPDPATLETDDDVTVAADRDRLRTLFENLFDNAVGLGGPHVTVTVRERADGAGFVVRDDGPGFDTSDPTELFQYGTTVENAGTGLGLALVRDIAEAHDWAVDVSSPPTGGATFVFDTDPS